MRCFTREATTKASLPNCFNIRPSIKKCSPISSSATTTATENELINIVSFSTAAETEEEGEGQARAKSDIQCSSDNSYSDDDCLFKDHLYLCSLYWQDCLLPRRHGLIQ
jgi:hypothetical protein